MHIVMIERACYLCFMQDIVENYGNINECRESPNFTMKIHQEVVCSGDHDVKNHHFRNWLPNFKNSDKVTQALIDQALWYMTPDITYRKMIEHTYTDSESKNTELARFISRRTTFIREKYGPMNHNYMQHVCEVCNKEGCYELNHR